MTALVVVVNAAPSEQPPPVASSLNSSAIQLHWSPPDRPNGVIQLYRLYRNSTLVANVTSNGTRRRVQFWGMKSRAVATKRAFNFVRASMDIFIAFGMETW